MQRLRKKSGTRNIEPGTWNPESGTLNPESGTRNPELGTFSWPIRVYYEDTDSAGVVYYANYLKFMERARTEWLRAAGFEQHDIAAQHQAVFVVRAVAIEYLKPALFNDSLQATVELAKVGNSQIVLVQRVLRAGEELATAEVRVVCVNAATFRPVRIPKAIITRIGMTS